MIFYIVIKLFHVVPSQDQWILNNLVIVRFDLH